MIFERERNAIHVPTSKRCFGSDLLGRVGEFGFSAIVDLKVPKKAVWKHGIRLVGRTSLGESFVMTIPDIYRDADIAAMSSKLFGEFSLKSPDAFCPA